MRPVTPVGIIPQVATQGRSYSERSFRRSAFTARPVTTVGIIPQVATQFRYTESLEYCRPGALSHAQKRLLPASGEKCLTLLQTQTQKR